MNIVFRILGVRVFHNWFLPFQDCVPIRLKAVHIINQPYIFNMLFAIFKPFLREKLRSRIHFHGSSKQSLLSHVDASALRIRHGGTLPDPEIPGDLLWQMLHHYEEDFKGKLTCCFFVFLTAFQYKMISVSVRQSHKLEKEKYTINRKSFSNV